MLRHGRVAGRDRPSAAPPRAEDHRDIRQGRPQGAAGARPPVAVAGRCGMTTLPESLADYLAIRRRLGFDCPRTAGCSQGSSISSTGRRRADHHRTGSDVGVDARARTPAPLAPTALCRAWVRPPSRGHRPSERGSLQGPVARASPADLAYIYTDAEITALMEAAGKLRLPLRVARHQTLIGLLANHGSAPWRGARAPRPPRRRSSPQRGPRSGGQAEQAARGAAARQHDPRAARSTPACATRVTPSPPPPAFFISANGRRMARAELTGCSRN